jgi:hypothetical protein
MSAQVLQPYANQRDAEEIEQIARRWVERIVIGLNLCPFAKAVYAKQQIRFAVTAAIEPDDLLAELEHETNILIETDPAELDTTLLVHPLSMLDFIDYHFFVAEADAALARLDLKGVLQIAGFHPDYCFARSDANDMANYTNRSPHPTLQLLRESSVERAVAAFPDASEIFLGNIHKLRALGLDGFRKL